MAPGPDSLLPGSSAISQPRVAPPNPNTARAVRQAAGRWRSPLRGRKLRLWWAARDSGIALHFLPKLRHAPITWPRLANAAIGLVAAGVGLRLGPALALLANDPAVTETAALGAALGAMLTLAGTAAAGAVRGWTHLGAPTLTGTAAIAPVVPLVGAAWASLLTAQALDVAGAVGAAMSSVRGVVPPTLDDAIMWLALPGWFIPIAMAFASRTLPPSTS